MADLTGTTPADTYKSLLQIGDATNGVDATAKYIEDGEGTDSALAISTGKVGIGTDSPERILTVDGGVVDIPALFKSDDSGSYISFMDNSTTDDSQVLVGAVGNELVLQSNSEESMRIDSDGNVGIGTDSFGTDAAGVIGIANATAPTSSPANMVQLYAKDDAGSSRLYVRNEAGTETVLSPHAADAPSSLYGRPPGVEEMHRSANYYLGTIVFTNVDRRNALMQKQLNGEDLPEDRTFTVTETFAEYNARTGADLQVEDWDANQQAMFDAQEGKVAARQAEIDAWDNEEEEAPEPLQSYVKKPKPDWLS